MGPTSGPTLDLVWAQINGVPSGRRDDNCQINTMLKVQLRERVNFEWLIWISENIDQIVPEERVKFRAYVQHMVEGSGERLVTYEQTACGLGRLYADGALSLQSFSKRIRNTLARGLYHDIDMVNAHPIILHWLCEKHGIKCPRLNYYIKDREVVLASLMESEKCTRNDAKVIMLSLMYGGANRTHSKYVALYTKELETIAEQIYVIYDTMPVTKNKDRPTFSRMSLLIQDIEHQMLMTMDKTFRAAGYEVGVYVFDGMMVYMKGPLDGPKGPLEGQILRQCEAQIRAQFGADIRLEEKPIGKGFDN
jgi:hypothetical protein